MNGPGAVSGMVVGLLFTLIYIIYFKFVLDPADNIPANWFLGISPEGIGTIGMVINFVVSFVVSSLTPAPPQSVQDMVEDIRIPSGAGQAQDH